MKKLSRFTRLAVLVPALLAALIPWANAQQEIGFIEDFSLAEDREIALKKLIP